MEYRIRAPSRPSPKGKATNTQSRNIEMYNLYLSAIKLLTPSLWGGEVWDRFGLSDFGMGFFLILFLFRSQHFPLPFWAW